MEKQESESGSTIERGSRISRDKEWADRVTMAKETYERVRSLLISDVQAFL